MNLLWMSAGVFRLSLFRLKVLSVIRIFGMLVRSVLCLKVVTCRL